MTGFSTTDVALDDVSLHVIHAGNPSDPTVLLVHGFPEVGYSWRHQIAALVDAGYHVVAPTLRGYGYSSVPDQVEAYGIKHLVGDLCQLLDYFGKDDAVFVGHDWGAMIVWDAARLQPARVRAVVGVSVPFVQWPAPPTQLFTAAFADRFFYMLYFQQPGLPEAELQADPQRTMHTILHSLSGPGFANRNRSTTALPPMQGTGFLTTMPSPAPLPLVGIEGPWLTAEDLEVYADAFAHSGFFGPISFYRNLDANFTATSRLSPSDVTMPSFFIGGTLDVVMEMDPSGIARMQRSLPDFRGHVMIEGAGHWIQQEAPTACNDALLEFLRRLDGGSD